MTITDTDKLDVTAEAIRDRNWYSDDELANIKIEAFQAGIKHSKDQAVKKLRANLEKAKEISEAIHIQLFTILRVKTREIKLRPTFFNSFEAIFIIPKNGFLSPERFELISKISADVIKEHVGRDFSYTVLFMPFTRRIDEKVFDSDGFHLTFGLRK